MKLNNITATITLLSVLGASITMSVPSQAADDSLQLNAMSNYVCNTLPKFYKQNISQIVTSYKRAKKAYIKKTPEQYVSYPLFIKLVTSPDNRISRIKLNELLICPEATELFLFYKINLTKPTAIYEKDLIKKVYGLNL